MSDKQIHEDDDFPTAPARPRNTTTDPSWVIDNNMEEEEEEEGDDEMYGYREEDDGDEEVFEEDSIDGIEPSSDSGSVSEPIVSRMGLMNMMQDPEDNGAHISPVFSNSADPLPIPPDTPTLEASIDAIKDFDNALDANLLGDAFDELRSRWLDYSRDCGANRTLECAYRLYGFSPEDVVSVKDLSSREADIIDKILHLYYRYTHEGMIELENTESQAAMLFVRILELVNNMKTLIQLYHRNQVVTDTTISIGSTMVHKWHLSLTVNDDDTSQYQKLLLYVLEMLYKQNMRKYNERLYKQVLVINRGRPPYRTHAWEVECEMPEFVYRTVKKETNYDMWLNMTASKDNVRGAVDYMKNCVDFQLPALVPNRRVFSFRNCVYDAGSNTVYEFGNKDHPIPSNLVAAKFFDIVFPLELAVPDEHGFDIDFRDIKTPNLDKILLHQKISEEMYYPVKKRTRTLENGEVETYEEPIPDAPGFSVKDWFYVFIGRMIYEIGEHDDWQVLLFLKGVAGSGKSTLGKLVSYLYDPSDVGVLSNNTEKKFGLSALVEKLIYICYEVKNDFALDQGEFQCMVSGEQMSIPVKFQTATSVSWKTHGMFMGNEVASWCDNSGSMSRRIVLGLFNEMVTESNPKLYSELQAEMGHTLLKANRAYREAAAAFGGLDIWKVLPPYFSDNRRKLRAETHALAFFIENCPDVVLETNVFMSLEDLKLMMKLYLASEGSFKTTTKAFTADFYQWVFDAYKLNLRRETRKYKDQVRKMPFVFGIGDRNNLMLVDEDAVVEQDDDECVEAAFNASLRNE